MTFYVSSCVFNMQEVGPFYTTKILTKLHVGLKRGQDSNLQSSGHGPDESTNSSTPLVPLL